MKTFQEFMESVPAGVIPHLYHLGEIQAVIDKQKRKISELAKQNYNLFKALAQIKINLERALKDKSKLNDAVYDAINKARGLTPYTSDYGLTHQIDPDLTDEEKTL